MASKSYHILLLLHTRQTSSQEGTYWQITQMIDAILGQNRCR